MATFHPLRWLAQPSLGARPTPPGWWDLALRFGTTAHRQTLLNGLLELRSAFRGIGLLEGFQWVDGSFVDDSAHWGREPQDIDIVTFAHPPHGKTQRQLWEENRELVHPPFTKAKYGVDSYLVILEPSDLVSLTNQVVYWTSLWSHDRNSQWKGYLQIDLSDSGDAAAKAVLRNPADEGGPQ